MNFIKKLFNMDKTPKPEHYETYVYKDQPIDYVYIVDIHTQLVSHRIQKIGESFLADISEEDFSYLKTDTTVKEVFKHAVGPLRLVGIRFNIISGFPKGLIRVTGYYEDELIYWDFLTDNKHYSPESNRIK